MELKEVKVKEVKVKEEKVKEGEVKDGKVKEGKANLTPPSPLFTQKSGFRTNLFKCT